MTSYIAVDLGGTNIRAAQYTPQGELIARAKRPTLFGGGGEVLERLVSTVQEVMPANGSAVKAIGIGAPGPLNPFTGVILNAPNLPGWINFPLKQILESRLHIPIELGNDANMAALGEWKYGAGRGHNDVLYLTISTGIGGGVISGGRLIVGVNGMAAELGHVAISPDGPVCGCGQRGHLEALASGPSMARTARARLRAGASSTILEMVNGEIDTVTAEHIGDAAKAGDAFALSILEEAGVFIGRAVANFMHIFNPSVVILGGGVSNNVGDLLLQPVRGEVQRRVMTDLYSKDTPIVKAQLGDDVGLLGTLALAIETHPAF